jgi:hypothetical protein
MTSAEGAAVHSSAGGLVTARSATPSSSGHIMAMAEVLRGLAGPLPAATSLPGTASSRQQQMEWTYAL